MLDLSVVQAGDRIEYKGNTLAYGGTYEVLPIEVTYINPNNCPEEYKGKLVIIEFMNDDTPMFIRLDKLQAHEWELKKEEA